MANEGANGKSKNGAADPIVIKKYANRRLYNTATSSYVTLDYLADMVKNGEDFVVYDAKTGNDITHPVLTQIIFEEESKGESMLPTQFLRQLIKYYGDSLQSFVPSYLELSMDTFSRNQENFRDKMMETFSTTPGYSLFEDSIRKNMELYQQAMQMFSPLVPTASNETPSNDAEIDQLRAQLAELQTKLEKMEKQAT